MWKKKSDGDMVNKIIDKYGMWMIEDREYKYKDVLKNILNFVMKAQKIVDDEDVLFNLQSWRHILNTEIASNKNK